MFKLLHGKIKYSRGFRILAEQTYVQIGLLGFKLTGNDDTSESHITIRLWSGNDDYTLVIPDDKVDSVIARLQEAKANKERNARAVSSK